MSTTKQGSKKAQQSSPYQSCQRSHRSRLRTINTSKSLYAKRQGERKGNYASRNATKNITLDVVRFNKCHVFIIKKEVQKYKKKVK